MLLLLLAAVEMTATAVSASVSASVEGSFLVSFLTRTSVEASLLDYILSTTKTKNERYIDRL